MEKPKKVILGFLVVSLIIIAILYGMLLYKKSNTFDDAFYYGITCPHCKIVEEYILQNNITEKVVFEQKEVYIDKTNAAELISIGKKCKLKQDYVGAVPLLYYNGTCYLGDAPIIDFLNKTITNKI
jgi:hypothetical protein